MLPHLLQRPGLLAAPKIFFRYYYVNSSTGEKSGIMLAETKWAAAAAVAASRSLRAIDLNLSDTLDSLQGAFRLDKWRIMPNFRPLNQLLCLHSRVSLEDSLGTAASIYAPRRLPLDRATPGSVERPAPL